MNRFYIGIVSLLVLVYTKTTILAQDTGYSDSFEGAMKVSGPPSFAFIQENGVLNIMIDKESKVWQGVYYTIGKTIDITSHPFMNLKFKTDTPFLLTAYIVDADDNYVTRNVKIYASGTYNTYGLDFSGLAGVDASRITALIFTPNGNTHDGLIADAYVDELKLGSDAQKLAGIGAAADQLLYQNTSGNKLTILDLAHAENINVSGTESSINNITVSAISQGLATVTFDCQSGFTGMDTLTVTALGSTGYADNTIHIPIAIEGNLPPLMNGIPDLEVMVGDTILIRLIGISDGNASIEQTVLLNASSNNQDALPDANISITHSAGESVGQLTLMPIQSAENIEVTIHLDDQYSVNNIASTSFKVTAFEHYNHTPTIDFVPDQFIYLSQGQQTLTLTGISDGDDGNQQLTFTTSSSIDSVLPDTNITINHIQGNDFADFIYTPEKTGKTTVRLKLEDDGGTDFNNGNAEIELVYEIEVGTLPPTGHTIPMAQYDTTTADTMENIGDWKIEGNGTAQTTQLGTFHGKDHVIKIDLIDKSCWTGIWYRCPEINVDKHRYLCYDIYFEGGDFAAAPGQTHCYYWDDGEDAGLDRNVDAAHAQRKTVSTGQWETVFMDFRSPDGMINSEGEEINTRRIQKILINYATDFSWPFPVNNGTVYLTNIKLGSEVPAELVPAITPRCTIDPLADQTLFPNAGQQTIALTGITDGFEKTVTPTVSASSNNKAFIPDPEVSAVEAGGTAQLSYQVADGTGTATITLIVSATGSSNLSISFKVTVVDNDPNMAVTVYIEKDSLYQTMYGFGTYSFSGSQNYMDYYTDDLGASAMRVGIIGNQVEPVNDNNDPNVLNMDALNYNAFDFDYYRQLKEAGVETFILTSWSPPAWMKRNMSESYAYAEAPNYTNTDNVLEPYYYQEFAEALIAVIKVFKSEAGIDLAAIGPQNEPAFCEPYPSAVLGPQEFADLVAVIGARFETEGISTKLYMPEHVFYPTQYSMSQYINALKANDDADNYTDIVAVHHYAADGIGEANPTYPEWTAMWNQSQTCQYPKEFWMTETYPEYSNWNSALSLAGAIHGALVYGNIGLWTLWNIEGTLMDTGKPTASFYTSKNYYKHIRPGARRIRATSGHNDILASSFIDAANKKLTTVLINKSTAPITVKLYGDSIPAEYEVYTTAEHVNFVSRGKFSANQPIALPSKSVTTLVGATDGAVITGVSEIKVPDKFHLYQNYPNPFNPTTTFRFTIPITADASLIVYNILGQKVRTLINKTVAAGEYHVTWDGKNEAGNTVASGIYFYQLRAKNFMAVKKCILLR
jgi:glucuronoarabinoxylan endo-1,4-beta-xylanase